MMHGQKNIKFLRSILMHGVIEYLRLILNIYVGISFTYYDNTGNEIS